MAKIVFKKDKSKQMMLLPPDLGSLIPENHLVRVVDRVIDGLNLSVLFDTYKGGGASSYSPRVMLKILIYAYIEKIYTTRRIEKALRENINFMWISGMSTPDHGTIHNFRAQRMRQAVEEVFSSVVEVLIKRGYVKAENLFVDGTKIEANANRYSYIWRKSVEKHELRTKEKVRELLAYIEQLQREEDAEYGTHNLEELEGNITSEQIEEVVGDINNKLKGGAAESRKAIRVIKKLKDEYIPRIKKYEQQKEMLQQRNSCSKTDKDATFFRMKGDELKPGYNIQIGTENQFILGYGVYQKATDTTLLVPFLEKVKKQLGRTVVNVIADAGYGSTENYEYIKRENIGNYVKYNNFYYEKSKKYRKKVFLPENFEYDINHDQYRCSAGQVLDFIGIKEGKSENGYNIERRVYQSRCCEGCIYKEECCKGKNPRNIEVNHRYIESKNIVRQNLESEKGIKIQKQRGIDVESVFAQIKHNNQFRRFNTRGLANVSTEWGIISIAHNIKKMAN